MSQSRLGSFMESLVNIIIGYTIAVAAQMVIFPIYGIHVAHSVHFEMGLFFTVVSLVRSYLLRRLFNGFTRKAVK